MKKLVVLGITVLLCLAMGAGVALAGDKATFTVNGKQVVVETDDNGTIIGGTVDGVSFDGAAMGSFLGENNVTVVTGQNGSIASVEGAGVSNVSIASGGGDGGQGGQGQGQGDQGQGDKGQGDQGQGDQGGPSPSGTGTSTGIGGGSSGQPTPTS